MDSALEETSLCRRNSMFDLTRGQHSRESMKTRMRTRIAVWLLVGWFLMLGLYLIA